MSESFFNSMSRRDVLKTSGQIAAATALAGIAVPKVHAAESSLLQVALVGCGGRGTGAAGNALATKSCPIKLVAMADVFDDKLKSSYDNIKKVAEERTAEAGAATDLVDVPDDRKFIGFDAYQKAMDCLNPGDVVILATPPAFRWVHFKYAIDKGLNVFMEKPTAVDGPSVKKMLDLAALSEEKNLKVGVGLMCRHCVARAELFDRIKNGEIGDLVLLRAYRMAGPTAHAFAPPKPDDISELMYQIKKFHAFLWASGGAYSDFLIHNIDECCWMKDAWPVEAKASGGRHYRGDYIDQNFDSYSTEFTFADGSKLYLEGRTIEGCYGEFASYAHGSKGSAVISTAGHAPSKARIYKGQKHSKEDLAWAYPPPEPSPYQLEWDNLVDAIYQNKPFNEARRGAEASLVTAMGRMAAHTGQIITWDTMLNCPHEFAPNVDQLALDGPAPLQLGSDGTYPVPQPGINKEREF
ncbi:MAG: Gfo/Idh/MocA family oxidoreductase [Pirellulales bacterium]